MAETLINKNQAGSGIWTSDTLKAGKNIEIAIKTNPYVIDEHTLGCWHFNNNGDNAVQGGYSMVLQNASYTNLGKFDSYCLKLGIYCSSADYAYSLLGGNNFTIDAWVKLSGVTVKFGAGSSARPNFVVYNNGVLGCESGSDSSYGEKATDATVTSSTITDGNWHHVAFCLDTSLVYYFVDGVLLGTGAIKEHFNGFRFSCIEGTRDSGNSYVDELRVSNVCRWTEDFSVPTAPYEATASEPWYVINNKLKAGSNVAIASDGTISATYTAFTGTDGSSAGTMGLVPAPATTDTDKYLKSDGTWEEVSGNVPEGVYTQDNLVAGDGISLQHSSGQATVNYELVGNPTITSDYVASGFSSTSYVKGPLAPSDPVTSFQIDCKVITPSSFSPYEPIFGQIVTNKTTPQAEFDDGEIWFEVTPDGSSWTSLTVSTSGNFSPNTQYYIRFAWDGSYMRISISSDGISYSQIGSRACSGVFWTQQFGIGTDNGNSYSGSIYLSDFKVYVNGSLYWEAVTPGGITRINTDFTGVSGYDDTTNQVLEHFAGDLRWESRGYFANSSLSNITAGGTSLSAGWAMPSTSYENITVGASGASYTAPANGYYYFVTTNTSTQNHYTYLINETNGVCSYAMGNAAVETEGFVPVKKGQQVSLSYFNSTIATFRFVYAEGSKSEAN